MANVIIGIHGLGNKPSKRVLEHWWKMAMIEGLKSHKFKSVLPKFELVYWADITYDKPLSLREKNKESPYFLKERYNKAPKDFRVENHDTRKKIVSFLNEQLNRVFLNDDYSLNYSFISDSIVNTYFKDLEIYYSEKGLAANENQNLVKDLIRNRLLEVLKKYQSDNIMLISHSMGSIIAFDVLKFMDPSIKIHTLITMGSPMGLPIVISKIAAEQQKVFHNNSHMQTPPGVTENWFNFSDILDKVAFNYELADDFSENEFGIKPKDFLVVNNYEINAERNPHKSFGYLRTKEFSEILNDFILSEELSLSQKIRRKSTQLFNTISKRFLLSNQKKKT